MYTIKGKFGLRERVEVRGMFIIKRTFGFRSWVNFMRHEDCKT